MKASWKQSADGTQWQIIVEAQNDQEDIIIQDMYNTGTIRALGQTKRERFQLILSTAVPEWYLEEKRGGGL